MSARGLNNNNPGNIIKGTAKFLGEKESADNRFRQFQAIEYGYRAIFVLLNSYINKGFDTVEKIISRWAPSVENDTKSYINTVSKLSAVSPQTKVSAADKNTMVRIVAAMSQVENGIKANTADVLKGWDLIEKKK
jgi:hypothetical protein